MALSSPQEIQQRLENIEEDLAKRQNEYEHVTEEHFLALREREHVHAIRFAEAEGNTTEKRNAATVQTGIIGEEWEAKFQAMKAAISVIEGRRSALQSLLKTER